MAVTPTCALAVVWQDRCVGVVGINGSRVHRVGWFFYWMHPRARGTGLMSRAAAAAANWALGEGPDGGGFHRLELGHRANNPASRSVALAAGFLQEGVERAKFEVDGRRVDVLRYGRLLEDPKPTVYGLPIDAAPTAL